jgi:hypothetical protein
LPEGASEFSLGFQPWEPSVTLFAVKRREMTTLFKGVWTSPIRGPTSETLGLVFRERTVRASESDRVKACSTNALPKVQLPAEDLMMIPRGDNL